MHGSSPAAWTAVLVCLAGFIVGGVALIPDPHWVWFTVGVVLIFGSALVGRIMAAAGLGVNSKH